MDDLVQWLDTGVLNGYISAHDAYFLIAKKVEAKEASKQTLIQPPAVPAHTPVNGKPNGTTNGADNGHHVEITPNGGPRLKKDGSPWKKRGRKKKQADLPVESAVVEAAAE